jgi:hypothetical protein
MNQKRLIGVIVGVVLLVNIVGFALFRRSRASSASAPTTSLEAEENERAGKARRAAGVAALENGDYEKALINLTEARTLLGERAKVDDLLKVTDELRNRAAAKKAAPAPEAVAEPAAEPVAEPVEAPAAPVEAPVVAARAQPTAPTPKPKAPKRVAVAPVRQPRPEPRAPEPAPVVERTEPVEPPEPAPRAPTQGTVLISTTPRGLLVRIDGTSIDLTPMRTSLSPGAHRVTLFDGERKLHEATVMVVEGEVTTLIRDLSDEMKPSAPPAEERVEPKPELARPKPEPARPPPEVVATPPPERPAAAVAKGGLALTSPGLYGEIWVNGRPAGFPPATLEGLAPGPVKVEVRVNGVVRRSSTVVVEGGQTKAVRILP